MKAIKSVILSFLTLTVLLAPLGVEKAAAASKLTNVRMDTPIELSVRNSEMFDVTAYYDNNSSRNVNTTAVVSMDNWDGEAKIKLTGLFQDEWKIEGTKAGYVTINASYTEGSVTKTTSEKIKIRPSIGISSIGSMSIGDTYQTETRLFYDANAPQKITSGMTFSSSDPTVASISSTGLLKALKSGTTVIKVTYPDTVFGGTIQSSFTQRVY